MKVAVVVVMSEEVTVEPLKWLFVVDFIEFLLESEAVVEKKGWAALFVLLLLSLLLSE